MTGFTYQVIKGYKSLIINRKMINLLSKNYLNKYIVNYWQ